MQIAAGYTELKIFESKTYQVLFKEYNSLNEASGFRNLNWKVSMQTLLHISFLFNHC